MTKREAATKRRFTDVFARRGVQFSVHNTHLRGLTCAIMSQIHVAQELCTIIAHFRRVTRAIIIRLARRGVCLV